MTLLLSFIVKVLQPKGISNIVQLHSLLLDKQHCPKRYQRNGTIRQRTCTCPQLKVNLIALVSPGSTGCPLAKPVLQGMSERTCRPQQTQQTDQPRPLSDPTTRVEISLTCRHLLRLAVDLQDNGLAAEARIPLQVDHYRRPRRPIFPRGLHHSNHHFNIKCKRMLAAEGNELSFAHSPARGGR